MELTTARTKLRPPIKDDAQSIFRNYASDPEVTRYLVWPTHKNLEQTENHLKQCIANWSSGEELTWVIIPKQVEQCVGMIALRCRPPRAEMGYVLMKKYWGQGLMSEVAGKITAWALAQESIFRVWATCHIENMASARVLEKSGMVKEGILRAWAVFPNYSNEPQSCYVYSKIIS